MSHDTTKNDGGPAFPTPGLSEVGYSTLIANASQGMPLRDWFAGGKSEVTGDELYFFTRKQPDEMNLEERINAEASIRYLYADAMLKEREKK